jgi:hypothetical protein
MYANYGFSELYAMLFNERHTQNLLYFKKNAKNQPILHVFLQFF